MGEDFARLLPESQDQSANANGSGFAGFSGAASAVWGAGVGEAAGAVAGRAGTAGVGVGAGGLTPAAPDSISPRRRSSFSIRSSSWRSRSVGLLAAGSE